MNDFCSSCYFSSSYACFTFVHEWISSQFLFFIAISFSFGNLFSFVTFFFSEISLLLPSFILFFSSISPHSQGTSPDKTLVGDRGEGSAPYNARKSALATGGISEFEYRVDAKLGMVGGHGMKLSSSLLFVYQSFLYFIAQQCRANLFIFFLFFLIQCGVLLSCFNYLTLDLSPHFLWILLLSQRAQSTLIIGLHRPTRIFISTFFYFFNYRCTTSTTWMAQLSGTCLTPWTRLGSVGDWKCWSWTTTYWETCPSPWACWWWYHVQGGGCCEDEVVYKVNFEYRVILHTMELKQVFLLLYIHEYILSVPCCSCALFLRTWIPYCPIFLVWGLFYLCVPPLCLLHHVRNILY